MFTQTLAPVAVGLGLVCAGRLKGLAWISLALGSIAITALLTLFSQDPSFEFSGALQESFQIAADIWVFIAHIAVLGMHRDPAKLTARR